MFKLRTCLTGRKRDHLEDLREPSPSELDPRSDQQTLRQHLLTSHLTLRVLDQLEMHIS
jgi:hypothetical protein